MMWVVVACLAVAAVLGAAWIMVGAILIATRPRPRDQLAAAKAAREAALAAGDKDHIVTLNRHIAHIQDVERWEAYCIQRRADEAIRRAREKKAGLHRRST